MFPSARCKKTIAGILSVSILVVVISLLMHLEFFQDLFGPPKVYVIELEDGDRWYGQIAEEDENSIILDHVYHFHENNLNQLISHDSRRNPPKKIERRDIFSIGLLSEASPILKAIREYETE